MVAALPTSVEDEIVVHNITATKAIIEAAEGGREDKRE